MERSRVFSDPHRTGGIVQSRLYVGGGVVLRRTVQAAAAAVLLLGAGCTTNSASPRASGGGSSNGVAGALPVLRRDDVLWLERVSFGLNTDGLAEYRRLGRERYLDQQLQPGDGALPKPIADQIAALGVSRLDAAQTIAAVNAQRRLINAMPDGPDKQQARSTLNDQGGKLAYEALRRDVLRAIYSSAQLKEQLVWFWLNHFSVYRDKADLRWLVGDYEERAIRPHVLGRFRDLVLATLEHPAMLQYLDNSQNAAGHINENYARELMELHTLGVNAGYTQQDVQNLARVLTGVGVNAADPPKLRPDMQRLYVRKGAFEFNPARHDFGTKVLLGAAIEGSGFGEVEEAVGRIVVQPACARFIARDLAMYFVADNPPPALVERMAQTFMHSDGNIATVLRVMFLSHEFEQVLGGKFKDPMRYVVSAVRFAYDGKPILNAKPIVNWLNGLSEASYAHLTPDGYPMTEINWASSGQMSRRFEIARAIGSGNAGLFDSEDGGTPPSSGFPQLSNRLYFEAIEPFLGSRTKAALDRSNSQQEWNLFLLSSPDFSYE
jgi:uncharacterized protein (DUF1800 family)